VGKTSPLVLFVEIHYLPNAARVVAAGWAYRVGKAEQWSTDKNKMSFARQTLVPLRTLILCLTNMWQVFSSYQNLSLEAVVPSASAIPWCPIGDKLENKYLRFQGWSWVSLWKQTCSESCKR